MPLTGSQPTLTPLCDGGAPVTFHSAVHQLGCQDVRLARRLCTQSCPCRPAEFRRGGPVFSPWMPSLRPPSCYNGPRAPRERAGGNGEGGEGRRGEGRRGGRRWARSSERPPAGQSVIPAAQSRARTPWCPRGERELAVMAEHYGGDSLRPLCRSGRSHKGPLRTPTSLLRAERSATPRGRLRCHPCVLSTSHPDFQTSRLPSSSSAGCRAGPPAGPLLPPGRAVPAAAPPPSAYSVPPSVLSCGTATIQGPPTAEGFRTKTLFVSIR